MPDDIDLASKTIPGGNMEEMVVSNQSKLKEVMPVVCGYETKLASLNEWWGKIALIGKINSLNIAATIIDDMEGTKKKFSALQEKLIHNLLLEHLKKIVLDDTSRSQVAIDILIRNLFERTADVGFLATDDDIRDFLLKEEVNDSDLEFMDERLNEYVKKYSVYDEIIVLDTNGNVRTHLDKSNPISISSDPLITETLNTSAEYVETFRHSDLQPELRSSLIYSCKITATNELGSRNLGVLCLCFRFENEMEGIFANLLQEGDDSTIAILDEKNNVIASSNPQRLALNTRISESNSPVFVQHSSIEYIANITKTNGYQGFHGLGWSGRVMNPTKVICKSADMAISEEQCAKVIAEAKSFSIALKDIRDTAFDVNEDLSLVVLNGQITAARTKSIEFMPVLEEIKKIGADISNIFSVSINSLQSTVVSSRLNDVTFLASLAVDIMDRNLYERANDCRWWALTSEFRRTLSMGISSDEDAQRISTILAYINGLYTVYTNIYLYDKNGKILAVSNEEEKSIIGSMLDEQTGAKEALRIRDSQHYAVSPFIKSNLYADRHTYIYNASITSLEDSTNVVGGIGVVFDSAPQFSEMLMDSLPRGEKGVVIEEAFGVFSERNGKIISVARNENLSIGDTLEIDSKYFDLSNGSYTSDVIDYQGRKYAVGVAVSKGYREYKTTGDYKNDVFAFIFVPF